MTTLTPNLSWHTDLEAARAAAAALGRPILSLRLLGRLDEELSCANSRFFKTTLYPDPAVARVLREQFVLHWRSVRPVPKVRVDFGDGRVMERTLTGNSAHLVLDARGRVVDALPGLYGAKAFLRALEPAAALARASDGKLAAYHRAAATAMLAAWLDDLAAVGVRVRERSVAAAEAASTDAVWRAMAERHLEDARLSPVVAEVVHKLQPDAFQAGAIAMTKKMVEFPLLTKLMPLERSIAEDTLRNERQLHRRVSERLATETCSDEAELTDWMYEQLFLMPLDDPWLGMSSAFAAMPVQTA